MPHNAPQPRKDKYLDYCVTSGAIIGAASLACAIITGIIYGWIVTFGGDGGYVIPGLSIVFLCGTGLGLLLFLIGTLTRM